MLFKPETVLYRKRTIKAMSIGDGASAIIHPEVHRIDGKSVSEVLQKSREWIDAKFRNSFNARRETHIGTVDEYSDALSFIQLGPHETAMLIAHRKAPNMKLTAPELSEAAGWSGAGPANIHYGYLGRKIAEYLELDLHDGDDKYWTQALASFEDGKNQWKMHDELADALDKLNIT